MSKKNYNYKFFLPIGFVVKEIESNGEWKEKQCEYSDNSIFYINDEHNIPSVNYKNIEADKGAIFKCLTSKNDTLTVSGIDNQGKFWKNRKLKTINLGYLNVPKDKKEEFDKALSTVSQR